MERTQPQGLYTQIRQKVEARMREAGAWFSDHPEFADILTKEVVAKIEARKRTEACEYERLKKKQTEQIANHPKQVQSLNAKQAKQLVKTEADALNRVTWNRVDMEWRKLRPVVVKPVAAPKPESKTKRKKAKARSKNTVPNSTEAIKEGVPAGAPTAPPVEQKLASAAFHTAATAAKHATLEAH